MGDCKGDPNDRLWFHHFTSPRLSQRRLDCKIAPEMSVVRQLNRLFVSNNFYFREENGILCMISEG